MQIEKKNKKVLQTEAVSVSLNARCFTVGFEGRRDFVVSCRVVSRFRARRSLPVSYCSLSAGVRYRTLGNTYSLSQVSVRVRIHPAPRTN